MFRMLARCHDTAAVQLVEWPQIAMAGPLGINAAGPERIVNPLYYRPISVVTLNHSLDIGHARLLFIVNAVWPRRHTIRPLSDDPLRPIAPPRSTLDG